MPQYRKAVLALLVTVVLWSTSGVLIKVSTMPAMAIVSGRGLIASVVMLIYLRRPHFTWSVPQIGGAVASAITVCLFVTSTQLTSAANAILLQYTAPLWVAIFGIWYVHERPTKVDYVTMALIGAGMLLFFGDHLTNDDLVGNLLAAGSGISMAWMTLFMRKQKDGSPLETVLLGSLLSVVIGLPFLINAAPTATPTDWGILLFLGIFQLGIPYVLYAYAIKYLEAIESVLISTLEPILNPIWVFLVNGEVPGPMALLGGLVVVVAAAYRGIAGAGGAKAPNLSRAPHPAPASEPASQERAYE